MLKLLSHVFPVILTWIRIIFAVSDYRNKFKDCEFLKFVGPNMSFTVFSKIADNTESLFMNVRGVTDKIPI